MGLVSIECKEGNAVVATVGKHSFTIDLPPDEGGAGQGPTPVETLTAALGACMAMHIARYCKTAKLPVEGLTLDLDAQVAADPHRVASITADLNLPPGFPENRMEALKRVAAQCTIRNSLKETTGVDLEVLTAN